MYVYICSGILFVFMAIASKAACLLLPAKPTEIVALCEREKEIKAGRQAGMQPRRE
jgi:hypothetical protein